MIGGHRLLVLPSKVFKKRCIINPFMISPTFLQASIINKEYIEEPESPPRVSPFWLRKRCLTISDVYCMYYFLAISECIF
jgi:hypothetical protein